MSIVTQPSVVGAYAYQMLCALTAHPHALVSPVPVVAAVVDSVSENDVASTTALVHSSAPVCAAAVAERRRVPEIRSPERYLATPTVQRTGRGSESAAIFWDTREL
ncbi:hypothetical protein L6R52_34370 [Myxococcota bacterium]|nr:hypothetical protein [Myxococcota bacterium]